MAIQKTGKIGEERYPMLDRMIQEGKTAGEIASFLNVATETVRKYARKRGKKIVRQDMSMEKHPSWTGGTTLDRCGYILRRVPVDSEFGYLIRALGSYEDGRARESGYAPEHRIAMHKKLGRKLLPGEVVDHIDGNKQNNDPENLRVFASNSEHLKKTLKGKIPNWTDEGWNAMCAPRPQTRGKRQKR